MVSAYDPKWLGQTLVLKGTVSRVEVERDGDPKWVHIYFKESPDAIITACSPFPDMLRKKFGNDLSTLVGKTIKMAGQVEKFCKPQRQHSHRGSGADQAGELAFWTCRYRMTKLLENY